MLVRLTLVVALCLCWSVPAAADNSVFVDGAFNGRWGASFPPFIPQIIGPINFQQLADADGIAGMERVRPGSVVDLCPLESEKREFYGGDYDYQRRGRYSAARTARRSGGSISISTKPIAVAFGSP